MPHQLRASHILEIVERTAGRRFAQVTRAVRCTTLRRMLRFLWETEGTPKLDEHVPHLGSIRPRCVTASREQIEALLNAAGRTLRMFLLMCSDLAIRSGTAVRISPHEYDPARRILRFRTKYDEKVTLPVTAELADMFDECDLNSGLPFITQARRAEEPRAARRMISEVVDPRRLRKELRMLRHQLGIEKRIIPHDLRRTTAVALYKRTRDIRKAQALLGHHQLQSTFWYLDHDLEDVDLADLEAIKKPFIVHRKEQSA
ncbi:MAG TPA: tyrosine-type recombinase/integrase [Terracidiphilus sp.]|jgi:integrase|nr:tyrosine-type recombinase/integrase [Terracidiphilus sp.]